MTGRIKMVLWETREKRGRKRKDFSKEGRTYPLGVAKTPNI